MEVATRQKVLVVGEAPSRWMEEHGVTDPLPLAGRELANLAGVPWPHGWYEKFEPLNVLSSWPGKQGKGDAFPLTEDTLQAARRIVDAHFHVGRRVVLLGYRVRAAFGVYTLELFEWVQLNGAMVAVCPHPSHVNRWWNDHANVLKAREFWSKLA